MTDNITLPRELVERLVSSWGRDTKAFIVSMAALRTALAAPSLAVIVDPRLTPDEAAAISSALAAPPPQPDALALAERLASGRLAIIEQLTGELEALRRDAVHPGYIIGSHWLETAYSRVCAGEAEADVLRDCGWERVTDAEALRREAERYCYLRNRDPNEVFGKSGKAAGVWIDGEDDMAGLQLLTGDDADAAIDAAMGASTAPAAGNKK